LGFFNFSKGPRTTTVEHFVTFPGTHFPFLQPANGPRSSRIPRNRRSGAKGDPRWVVQSPSHRWSLREEARRLLSLLFCAFAMPARTWVRQLVASALVSAAAAQSLQWTAIPYPTGDAQVRKRMNTRLCARATMVDDEKYIAPPPFWRVFCAGMAARAPRFRSGTACCTAQSARLTAACGIHSCSTKSRPPPRSR
jgi:hypothetical protein